MTKQYMQQAPKQTQSTQPGIESAMTPQPAQPFDYQGAEQLAGKVAIITGGDSGIGRAVAMAFVCEGANIVLNYLEEEQPEAEVVEAFIQQQGRKALLVPGDITDPAVSAQIVEKTMATFGQINVVVNNAAVQYPVDHFLDITPEQWRKTFSTNIDSMFYLTQAALPHMNRGDNIICTTSVNAYKGHAILIDYTATKGAIVGFVRSLAQNLAPQGIRVNMVAPGPIWTPLIPATFDEAQVVEFGQDAALERPGQPEELVGAYVLLASQRGSYMTGQCIHVNGGTIMHS
jgi:NAD(P)-dependent dehydrogenase (short-subunit alcohol dehydrogenase family)